MTQTTPDENCDHRYILIDSERKECWCKDCGKQFEYQEIDRHFCETMHEKKFPEETMTQATKIREAIHWAGELAEFVSDNTVYEDGEYILYNTPGLINIVERIQKDAYEKGEVSMNKSDTTTNETSNKCELRKDSYHGRY